MPASSCMFLNIWSQECGHTNICYLPVSQILTFMTDLHFPAWFLSEIIIFKWGTCTYTKIILDNHSLLQLDYSQMEEKSSILASHELSLLQESSRSLCIKIFLYFLYPYSHTSLDAAPADVPISSQGSTALMKLATNGGPIQVSLMGHCKSKKRSQVDFPLFFLFLVLFHTDISEGEEKVEDLLIKISSAPSLEGTQLYRRTRLYEIISSFEDMLWNSTWLGVQLLHIPRNNQLYK